MAGRKKDSEGRILPENVTQRKDGSYMFRKMMNGKSYCLYGNTLGEIKQKRNIALGEIEKGEYVGKHEKMKIEKELAKKDITLNEWFFQWEKAYQIGYVKENNVQQNHFQYMKHFSDTIGRMTIKDIRQIHITEAMNELNKAGQSYGSLLRYNRILTNVFNAAIKNQLIPINPATGALKVKTEVAERRILTEHEEERFMKFIKNDSWGRKHVPFFVVGFNTGMRLGEILGLTWQDVDFEKNTITVNKTLIRIYDYIGGGGKMHLEITSPKTKKSNRVIPMLPVVRDALLWQKENQVKSIETIKGYSDFVFTTKRGTVQHPNNYTGVINRIIKRMNTEEVATAKEERREPEIFERFTPHGMRHTFATRCYERGVREKVIQSILGHSKLDMTLNVYTHVTDEMILDDLGKME